MARTASASVSTGATLNQDVDCGGSEWLSLIGVVGTAAAAATAAGDVSIAVLPYLDDAMGASVPTLVPTTLPLPTIDTAAAVLASSRAWIFARYRVAGIRKVQIQVKNNNAASKPVEANFGIA